MGAGFRALPDGVDRECLDSVDSAVGVEKPESVEFVIKSLLECAAVALRPVLISGRSPLPLRNTEYVIHEVVQRGTSVTAQQSLGILRAH